MEGLTPKQQETVKQFRSNVKDILGPKHDDYYLIRWLRARGFDLKKSEDMLRKHMVFRKEWNADTILQDYQMNEVLKKYFPVGQFGYAKDGCPVYYSAFGNLDIKGMAMSVKALDLIRYHIYIAEMMQLLMEGKSKMANKKIDKLVLIIDMENFTLKMLFIPGMDVIMRVFEIFEANYPESMKSCVIINCPKIWSVIYKMVKTVLSDDTKKKMSIFGGSGWQPKLLELIDADQLPKHYGGTATDPDGNPYCQSQICLGGPIPESLYLKEQEDFKAEKLLKVTVPARNSYEISCEVKKAGCLLKYVFMTKARDIKFSVWFHTGDEEYEQVVAPVKVSSHRIPENGIVECEKSGTYVLRFDNGFSWTHSKKVSYNVQVIDQEFDDLKITDAVSTSTMGAVDSPENGN